MRSPPYFCSADSFDYYSSADLSLKYDVVAGPPTVSSAAARNGPQGLYCGADAYLLKNIPNRFATITMGFRDQRSASASIVANSLRVPGWLDGQVCVAINSTGTILINKGVGTNLASSSLTGSRFNAWHYMPKCRSPLRTGTSAGSATEFAHPDGAVVVTSFRREYGAKAETISAAVWCWVTRRGSIREFSITTGISGTSLRHEWHL